MNVKNVNKKRQRLLNCRNVKAPSLFTWTFAYTCNHCHETNADERLTVNYCNEPRAITINNGGNYLRNNQPIKAAND